MTTETATGDLTAEEIARVRLILRRALPTEANTLTPDEIDRLRTLMPVGLFAPTFWRRACTVVGYNWSVMLAIYGAILAVTIFFLGVAQLFK